MLDGARGWSGPSTDSSMVTVFALTRVRFELEWKFFDQTIRKIKRHGMIAVVGGYEKLVKYPMSVLMTVGREWCQSIANFELCRLVYLTLIYDKAARCKSENKIGPDPRKPMRPCTSRAEKKILLRVWASPPGARLGWVPLNRCANLMFFRASDVLE